MCRRLRVRVPRTAGALSVVFRKRGRNCELVHMDQLLHRITSATHLEIGLVHHAAKSDLRLAILSDSRCDCDSLRCAAGRSYLAGLFPCAACLPGCLGASNGGVLRCVGEVSASSAEGFLSAVLQANQARSECCECSNSVCSLAALGDKLSPSN